MNKNKVAKTIADEDTSYSDADVEVEDEAKKTASIRSSSHRVSTASTKPIFCKDTPRLTIEFSTKWSKFT